MIGALIWIALIVVMIIFSTKAIKELEQGSKENEPHIIFIVVGAISGDIFYLLGGIFGLVANGQSSKTNN